jgi:Protein of unknown function (DUF1656)
MTDDRSQMGRARDQQRPVRRSLPEFRLGEVLVPWTVIIGATGFLTAWLVVAIMEYTGLSRHVWHLPLFFVGLVVLFSSLIGVAISP